MAGSNVFQWACEQLEAETSLSELEARGTIRIALRRAGLDAGLVAASEMDVVLRRVLPDELAARGIENAGDCCERLAGALGQESFAQEEAPDSPETVFARLGGDA